MVLTRGRSSESSFSSSSSKYSGKVNFVLCYVTLVNLKPGLDLISQYEFKKLNM